MTTRIPNIQFQMFPHVEVAGARGPKDRPAVIPPTGSPLTGPSPMGTWPAGPCAGAGACPRGACPTTAPPIGTCPTAAIGALPPRNPFGKKLS